MDFNDLDSSSESNPIVFWRSFYDNEIGTYVSWLTNDVKQVEDTNFSKIFNLFENGASCLFACIALYSIHYGLLLTRFFFFFGF